MHLAIFGHRRREIIYYKIQTIEFVLKFYLFAFKMLLDFCQLRNRHSHVIHKNMWNILWSSFQYNFRITNEYELVVFKHYYNTKLPKSYNAFSFNIKIKLKSDAWKTKTSLKFSSNIKYSNLWCQNKNWNE